MKPVFGLKRVFRPSQPGKPGHPGVATRRRNDRPLFAVRSALIRLALAAAFAALACLAVRSHFDGPVRWTPDGLYYQERLLEIRGQDDEAAFREVFQGPISATLRIKDPQKTGDPRWVKYNEPFYERRVAIPLIGAAIYPLLGEKSLLDLSLIGYVASILALFSLLLLRFRVPIASGVTLATIFLPALTTHASYPLTDSWGLALEVTAFATALLTLERGLRWLPLWVTVIVSLSFTRDSVWIAVLASAWCALRHRSRGALALALTGFIATLPALLLFRVPVKALLALLVNGSQPSTDTSWPFILRHYPHAVVQLVHDNLGFVRHGQWYTGLYLAGGLVALVFLHWRSGDRSLTTSLMTSGAVLGVAYVFAAPVFSAFRLELVLVPMAAFGLALALEWSSQLSIVRMNVLRRPPVALAGRRLDR